MAETLGTSAVGVKTKTWRRTHLVHKCRVDWPFFWIGDADITAWSSSRPYNAAPEGHDEHLPVGSPISNHRRDQLIIGASIAQAPAPPPLQAEQGAAGRAGAPGGRGGAPQPYAGSYPESLVKDVKFYWLGAGTTDTARDRTVTLSELVKKDGFNTTYREIPGRHYWFLWRDFLVHYAQVAFVPGAKS